MHLKLLSKSANGFTQRFNPKLEINNNITSKNKTIDTKDEKAIPGSYLDGFQKIDSKSIKLNVITTILTHIFIN